MIKLAFIAVLVFCGSVSEAYACFATYRSVPAEKTDAEKREHVLSTADYIFTAKLERFEYSEPERLDASNPLTELTQNSYQKQLAYFSVRSWWKGPGTANMVIETMKKRSTDGTSIINTSCDYEEFEVGKSYVIFARAKGDTAYTGNNYWTDLIDKSPVLSLLGEGRAPKAGRGTSPSSLN